MLDGIIRSASGFITSKLRSWLSSNEEIMPALQCQSIGRLWSHFPRHDHAKKIRGNTTELLEKKRWENYRLGTEKWRSITNYNTCLKAALFSGLRGINR